MLHSPWIAALMALFHLVVFHRGDPARGPARGQGRVRAPGSGHVVEPSRPDPGALGLLATRSLNGSVAGGLRGAFLSALALWGWIELAFLTGASPAPTNPCPRAAPEWERFIRAWGTIAYHEMLLAFTLIADLLPATGPRTPSVSGPSRPFRARISAKLNLYLGVRKINVEFIPQHLNHLPSHFRISRG
jgi:putative photosynthetic complex assembly protein 2